MARRHVLSATLALLLSVPSTADATIRDTAEGASGVSLASMIMFGSISVVYLSEEGTWLPPGWAWAQLAVSALTDGIGGWTVSEGNVGLGVATLAIGTLMLTHSVLSLVFFHRPKKKPPKEAFSFGVFPTPRGGVVNARWVF